MLTKLILVRHGESLANISHRFGGQHDYPLSQLGHTQADCTGRLLQNEPIDVFYSSDLSRAYETTVHLSAYHNHAPIIKEPGMREIYAGVWESHYFEEVAAQYPEDYHIWRTDIGHARPTGGESVVQLQIRVRKTIDWIVKCHQGQTICIGTHATPIRVMQCFYTGADLSMLKDIPWVPNASVTTICFAENGTVSNMQFGYADHLGAMETALPKSI